MSESGVSVYKLIGHFKTVDDAHEFSKSVWKKNGYNGLHILKKETLWGALDGKKIGTYWDERKRKWIDKK